MLKGQGSQPDGHDLSQAHILQKHSYGEAEENYENSQQSGCNSNRHLPNANNDLHLPLPRNRWWWRLPFDLLGKNRWPRPECRHARPRLIPKDVVTGVCQRIHIRVVRIERDVQFLFLEHLKFRCLLAI